MLNITFHSLCPPPLTAEAVVVHTFISTGTESPKQLSLRAGDVIHGVKPLQTKPGWSHGTIGKRMGIFPDSMVEFHIQEVYRGETYIFLSRASDLMYCKACHELAVEPQETSCCESIFCHACLMTWHNLRSYCPGCTTQLWDWHPARAIERMLQGMKVLCRNSSKGCSWTGELRDHATHHTGCNYSMVYCECKRAVLRGDLQYHLKETCRLRPYKCSYCNKKATYAEIVKKHLPVCPSMPIICPNNCGQADIRRDSLQNHLCTCPLQSLLCTKQCGSSFLRKDLSKHLLHKRQKRVVACKNCHQKVTAEESNQFHHHVCRELPIICPNGCSKMHILRRDMKQHLDFECPLEEEACVYANAGCNGCFSRQDRDKHAEENV